MILTNAIEKLQNKNKKTRLQKINNKNKSSRKRKKINEDSNDKMEISKYNEMGLLYFDQNNYKESIYFLEKALQLTISMNGEIHEQTINIYNNLCIVFEETCQYDKALDIYLRCTNNINEKYGEKHAENFKLLCKLGKLMILKNEFEKAEIYLKESFRLVNNLFGDQSIQSASIKNELGLNNKE